MYSTIDMGQPLAFCFRHIRFSPVPTISNFALLTKIPADAPAFNYPSVPIILLPSFLLFSLLLLDRIPILISSLLPSFLLSFLPSIRPPPVHPPSLTSYHPSIPPSLRSSSLILSFLLYPPLSFLPSFLHSVFPNSLASSFLPFCHAP